MGSAVFVAKLTRSTVVVKVGLPSFLSSILKHPGTKENGKNISIKARWHADRVMVDFPVKQFE